MSQGRGRSGREQRRGDEVEIHIEWRGKRETVGWREIERGKQLEGEKKCERKGEKGSEKEREKRSEREREREKKKE